MLTKLVKHEFISTWKVPVALDATLLVLGLLAHIGIRTLPYIKDSIGFLVIMFLFAGVYYMGIIAANIVTMVFLVMRYYKNLYTAEGYLTFTLPVSTNSIINAKVITGYVWTLLCLISTGMSVLIALSGLLGMADIPYEELSEAADEFLSVFGAGSSAIIAIVLLGLVSSLYNVLCLYVSVTVGQLWEKHKILGAVLSYVAIYVLNLIVSQIAMITSGFYNFMNDNLDAVFSTMYTGMLHRTTIISGILAIVFYVACIMITKKKVNLD